MSLSAYPFSQYPLPTEGIRLHTGDPAVEFRIYETDPASRRLEKYKRGKVYTFRVKVIDIKNPKNIWGQIYIDTTLSDD